MLRQKDFLEERKKFLQTLFLPNFSQCQEAEKVCWTSPKLDEWGIRLVTRRGSFTEEADSLLLLLGIPEGLSSEDSRELKKDWFCSPSVSHHAPCRWEG